MNPLPTTLCIAMMLGFAFHGQSWAQVAPNTQDANSQGVNADAKDDSVSFQTFYDKLASQGTWIQTDQYGYVFQPKESDPNWQPYTYGHWVDTNQGLAWNSDEPFGWATYHYGRWTNIDGYGWVWVPGYTWAPAWVSWRQDADEVGWAPLPPASDEGIDYYDDDDYFTDADYGYGYHIGDDCDLAYDIGPYWYNFCPIAYIGDRDCWRHFRDRRDNFGLIGHTRNVTNINFHRDGAGRFAHVTAQGPSVAALNAQAQTPIAHADLASATRLDQAGLHGNSLAVYAPRIDPATMRTARPASVAMTLAGTEVNRGTDITRPPAVNTRTVPAAGTEEQARAAAENSASANAKVATTKTRPSISLSQPLTMQRTSTRSSRIFGAGTRQSIYSHASQFTPSVSAGYNGQGVSREIEPGRIYPSTSVGQSYRSSSLFHTSVPAFHYGDGATFSRSGESYRSFAPSAAEHFSAPAIHYSAPAQHFSSGFSGGYSGGSHFSGGGGGAVSSGGHVSGGHR